MSQVLVADDPLYEQLYDVRREAMDYGNLVEGDMTPAMCGLRDAAPVQRGFLRDLLGLPEHHRVPSAVGRDAYACFSFETCDAAFRDHERFSSQILHNGAPTGEPMLGMLEMDEPMHRAYRATIQPMFLKTVVSWWRERWIDDIVRTLLDRLQRQERAELNLQLCARLPVHTVTRAIGMEPDDSLLFRNALMRSTASGLILPEEQRAAAETVERMLMELIARRRAQPGDDLVSGLVRAEIELPDSTRRQLTDREIMITARLVLLAGGGTSWRQFGILLWALLTHRDQLEAVKADRRLIDRAIDESMRWNGTVPVFNRLVVQDTQLGGVELRAGAVLQICVGAANRDPARWNNPDRFDLHRPFQSHLSFGVGIHQCVGMYVAKSELAAGLNALLDAFPDMRLDPEAPAPYFTGGLEQRGVSAIPVLLR